MTQPLSAEMIAAQLGRFRRRGNYITCCCPAHDDRHPSFTIRTTDKGHIQFKCFAGCSQEQIQTALQTRGLWPGPGGGAQASTELPYGQDSDTQHTIISPSPPSSLKFFIQMKDKGLINAAYIYFDPEGQILFVVTRKDPSGGKQICPYIYVEHVSGNRQWIPGTLPSPRPLYGLHDLTKRPEAPVLIVEGEKSADAVRKHFMGHASITWPGGASAVDHADWSPLRGRDVTLWPDADRAGLKAMEDVRKRVIAAGARSVRYVQLPPDLPEGWDLADEVPDTVDVQQLLNGAKDVGGGLWRHIQPAQELSQLDLPPKSYLVEPWLPEGGLAMIWAERGLGKTWFSLELALCIAEGKRFLTYEVSDARTVLYIDGEMPQIDIKERLNALRKAQPKNLYILSSEILFTADAPLNINDESDQERIVSAIDAMEREGVRPSLIILDNLSSLAAGLEENSNSDLDKILRFLRRLRHKGITVLFVHHAGKSGEQRGASRREDLLDTSIKLARPRNTAAGQHQGAHFDMEFTKTRGRTPKPNKLEIKLMQAPDGTVRFSWGTDSFISVSDQILRLIAKDQPKTQAHVAKQLELSEPQISKYFSSLVEADLIRRKPISLTNAGKKHVLKLWPELRDVLAEQENIPF